LQGSTAKITMKKLFFLLTLISVFAFTSCNTDSVSETNSEEFSKQEQANLPPAFIPQGETQQANGYTACNGGCNQGCETGWVIYSDGQGHFYKHYWSISKPAPYSLSATNWITTTGGAITWHQTTWVGSCNG